ncbi:MAG: hypothetical protein M1826_005014 [Phylliscum demangeonii]|nr:MAG: hypothetical protein M1826_005014 [Phylliscum demangeonii]
MATLVHCLFCFEVLAAKLDHRPAPTLWHVQERWERYQAFQRAELDLEEDEEDEGDVDADPDVDLMDEGADDVDMGQGEEDDEDDELDVEDEEPERGVMPRPALRAELQRLAVPSPPHASSSSTPSSRSTASSSRTPASTLASSTNSSSSSLRAAPLAPPPRSTRLSRPLFVTWSTISRTTGQKSLRGCIGTFESQELEAGLRNYALTSAFEDSRFAPINKRELRGLEVGVTLLTDFEPAPSAQAWELGKHGIRISFTHHARRHSATYLPDVPLEQGWTKEETVISLMRKAGWTGRPHDWRKVVDLTLVRYQGKKVAMAYEAWISWRRWVERQGLL